MGGSASVQALDQRVSKAEAKAVAGSLFDADTFAKHAGEDNLITKRVLLKIAKEREITHETVVINNLVQFSHVKFALGGEWEKTKGTERLNAIVSFNLTKAEVSPTAQ